MLELLEEYIEKGKALELEELLKTSPELAVQNTSKQLSPILLACYLKKPDLAEILLKYATEPSLFDACAMGRFDWVTHHLYKHPESIHAYTENGFTALSLAVYFGHEEIIRYLLLKGANPNQAARNNSGIYPLHTAINKQQNMLAKMLLEAGAYANVSEATGLSPLHAAAEQGNLEMIIALLEAGADVKAKTLDGKTAGDMAHAKGWIDIGRILND